MLSHFKIFCSILESGGGAGAGGEEGREGREGRRKAGREGGIFEEGLNFHKHTPS